MFAMTVDAAPVSGSVVVGEAALLGIGPCRLYLKVDSGALTGCVVRRGPDLDHLETLDDSTFATLSAGDMASIRIESPVSAIQVEAAGVGTVSLWLDDAAQAIG